MKLLDKMVEKTKLFKNSIAFFGENQHKEKLGKKELGRNSHGSCENMADGRILRDKIKGGKFLFSEKMMAQI